MIPSRKFTNHEISILEFLLKEGEVYKTKLIPIVSSPPILSNELKKLESDGLVIIKEKRMGRKSFLISLSPKGRLVAEKLKEAEEIASGKSIPKATLCIDIPEGLHEDILKILKIDRKSSDERDFVLDAVKKEVERWKREHPGHP